MEEKVNGRQTEWKRQSKWKRQIEWKRKSELSFKNLSFIKKSVVDTRVFTPIC